MNQSYVVLIVTAGSRSSPQVEPVTLCHSVKLRDSWCPDSVTLSLARWSSRLERSDSFNPFLLQPPKRPPQRLNALITRPFYGRFSSFHLQHFSWTLVDEEYTGCWVILACIHWAMTSYSSTLVAGWGKDAYKFFFTLVNPCFPHLLLTSHPKKAKIAK